MTSRDVLEGSITLVSIIISQAHLHGSMHSADLVLIYTGDLLIDRISEITVIRLRHIGDNSWHQSAVWALRFDRVSSPSEASMKVLKKHPGRWRAQPAMAAPLRSHEGGNGR